MRGREEGEEKCKNGREGKKRKILFAKSARRSEKGGGRQNGGREDKGREEEEAYPMSTS